MVLWLLTQPIAYSGTTEVSPSQCQHAVEIASDVSGYRNVLPDLCRFGGAGSSEVIFQASVARVLGISFHILGFALV